MRKAIVLVVLALALVGVSRCGHLPIDSALALAANDYTGLIEGCGHQVNSGFIVCRKTEGDAANDSLYFIGPPTKCPGDGPCVSFKIFYPDGGQPYADVIPRGETRKGIPWSTLLRRSTFELGDRGFWGYSYVVRYDDGAETYTQGEIYMRVLKRGYVALIESPNDPLFAWSWVENGVAVKMTTGGRTYVGDRAGPK